MSLCAIVLAGSGIPAFAVSNPAVDEPVSRPTSPLALESLNNLASTSWSGTATFKTGTNKGKTEQAVFNYYGDHTLKETTNGMVGDFNGTGTWTRYGFIFTNRFIEPIAHTNLEVHVSEVGIISLDGMQYDALGRGQLYSVTNGVATPVAGSSGDTISTMTKQ